MEGKIPIMEIDIQGARSIKKIASRFGIRPKYLFVRPPDIEKLRERLTLRYALSDTRFIIYFYENYLFMFLHTLLYVHLFRGTENEEEVALRLANAVTELSQAGERGLFDAIIVNDDFDAATRSFFRLIRDW